MRKTGGNASSVPSVQQITQMGLQTAMGVVGASEDSMDFGDGPGNGGGGGGFDATAMSGSSNYNVAVRFLNPALLRPCESFSHQRYALSHASFHNHPTVLAQEVCGPTRAHTCYEPAPCLLHSLVGLRSYCSLGTRSSFTLFSPSSRPLLFSRLVSLPHSFPSPSSLTPLFLPLTNSLRPPSTVAAIPVAAEHAQGVVDHGDGRVQRRGRGDGRAAGRVGGGRDGQPGGAARAAATALGGADGDDA